MDERVLKLKNPEACERFAKNATERNRPDLAREAREWSIKLRAKAHGAKTDAEREYLEAVYAYEEILAKKNGKKTRASRTWQMIKRHGIIKAVERAVDRPRETVGYSALVEMGLEGYAFEEVVCRYPELFSDPAIERSRARIKTPASE